MPAAVATAFFHRSETWYRVSQREPRGSQVWADAEARYYAELDVLVRAALGPLAADADAVTVVAAVLTTWGHRGYPGSRSEHRDCGRAGVRSPRDLASNEEPQRLTVWLDLSPFSRM
jgi:hypothetical protein